MKSQQSGPYWTCMNDDAPNPDKDSYCNASEWNSGSDIQQD